MSPIKTLTNEDRQKLLMSLRKSQKMSDTSNENDSEARMVKRRSSNGNFEVDNEVAETKGGEEEKEDENDEDEESPEHIRRTFNKGETIVDNADDLENERGKNEPLNFDSQSSESDYEDSLVEDDPYEENAR